MTRSLRRDFARLSRLSTILASVLLAWQASSIPRARAASSTIVISQVYGGGGNAGATFKNDFIELFNRGNTTVSLAGWSVQYASAAGTTWQVTNLVGTLEPGRYYLVQEAQGAGGTTNLPTPDATGTINMSATAGKVALANSTTAFTGTCPSGGSLIDFVGFGTANCAEGSPTALLSNTTAALRGLGGCTDTDNNSTDFSVASPSPRNTSSPATSCAAPTNPSGNGSANPALLKPGDTTLLTVAVTPGANPTSTGITVVADLSPIVGSATQAFFDDGTHGDGTAGDNIFSFQATAGDFSGRKTLIVTIADGQSRSSTTSIGVQGPAPVVISQIYGGGGNSGASYKNDFIELFNRTSSTVDLTGWSVQYTSSAGTTWAKTDLSGTLGPGQYFLVQEAAGAGGTINLIPDATGTLAMSATAGKVALVSNGTLLASSGCPFAGSVVDFVGYGGASCFEGSGPVATLTNTTAAKRIFGGCTDDNNNVAEFSTGSPEPRNRTFPPTDCSAPPPPPIPIDHIQGNGTTSPLVGQIVTMEGVVTAVRFNNGFFIQTPEVSPDNDGDPSTSEGVFVFTGSAPPAAAAVGNFVQVRGLVQEFIPSADPNSPPVTEIGSPIVTLISSGNDLPAPITLTAADTDPAGPPEQLERFEGMRVQVASLTTTAPTQGSIDEPNATSTSNGVFYGVITGVARPFREAGIEVPDPLPAGSPCCVPRFDANPERLRVDSDGQVGGVRLNLTAGVTVTGLVGPLDYSFRTYTILPDPPPAPQPTVTVNMSALPVPDPSADQFTVASANLERFFDTEANSSAPVLTATAFANRLHKASLMIRDVMRSPDIVGVEEVENIGALEALADKLNADAVAAGHPNPGYEAYLEEGNDIGGIDSGFLVKSARVHVIDVTQEGKDKTFTFAGATALLNDRPPLVLRATIAKPSGQPYAVTVIVNHLRSLSGVDDPVDGDRVRHKRQAQAEYLANLIQARQADNPNERIISVGDYNAFQFSDGYVDSIGTIKGTPTPADQVVLASGDLVNPDLVDLVDTAPPDQRYSFSFDGNAQELDHVLVTKNLLTTFGGLQYGRNNADFPESYRNDPDRSERISDHDPVVAYFSFPADAPPTADAGPAQTVDADPTCQAAVTLDGSLSSDPDGDALSYTWTGPFGTATGASPTVTLTRGTHVIGLTVDDGFGAAATSSITITVVDITPPVITLSGPDPLVHEAATPFVDPGASALDACDGARPVTAISNVKANVPGGYGITYSALDISGNNATASRTVSVVDTTRPVVTIVGPNPFTVECHGTFIDPGATALDTVAGNLTAGIVVAGAVDTSVVGSYALTYSATDPSGNTGAASRTVNVSDTLPPTLSLVGADPFVVELGAAFVDPGATASDACAGNLAAAIQVTSNVNTSAVGTYSVTYSVQDGSGHMVARTRSVKVVDTTAPTITSVSASPNVLWSPNHKLVPVTIAVSATDLGGATTCRVTGVTNNETGSQDAFIRGPLRLELLAERGAGGQGRVYTIVVRCTDASGNAASANTTVLVPHDLGQQ
jgi:predicted extracellular nuclease